MNLEMRDTLLYELHDCRITRKSDETKNDSLRLVRNHDDEQDCDFFLSRMCCIRKHKKCLNFTRNNANIVIPKMIEALPPNKEV